MVIRQSATTSASRVNVFTYGLGLLTGVGIGFNSDPQALLHVQGTGYFTSNVQIGGAVSHAHMLDLYGDAWIQSHLTVDGNLLIAGLAQFSGTSSSFPALKRSGTTLAVRLADDSADAPITASNATFSGNFSLAGLISGNLAVGTATGTKIATATTQKLGFWNATPVVQPTAVANATDAATVITQLNALLARLRTIGMIAT
jgi:hypothetical protein